MTSLILVLSLTFYIAEGMLIWKGAVKNPAVSELTIIKYIYSVYAEHGFRMKKNISQFESISG